MWKTVRIRQKEYETVKELARREGKSMCEAVSKIVAEWEGGKIKEIKADLTAKAALSILIAELDSILRDTRIPAERKVEKIEALLYTWVMGNKLSVWEVRNWKGLAIIGVENDERRKNQNP